MIKHTLILLAIIGVTTHLSEAQNLKSLQVDLLPTGPSVDFSDFPDFAAIYIKSEISGLKITSQVSLISRIAMSGTETILIVTPTEQRLIFDADGYNRELVDIPSLGTRQVIWIDVTNVSSSAIGVIFNPQTGRTWMDRNLGASRVAMNRTDEEAFGDLYQWGRGTDGHQKWDSQTEITLSKNNQPGHGFFIVSSTHPRDWRSPQNDRLWQGVNGVNNPCPSGFRLPTTSEWNAERRSWVDDNVVGAFTSLKLPLTGYRLGSFGNLHNVGTKGYYWSSTINDIGSDRLFFDYSSAFVNAHARSYGNAVRCIKD